MPLPKGIKPMTPTNAAFAFNITEPLNKELFDSLSEWTRRTIMESKEYKRIHGPKDVPLEDDEPQGAPISRARGHAFLGAYCDPLR
jgi:hypothetical protein